MSLSAKLRSAGFWQLVEVFALVVCQFGYFSIMARLLEKEDFGFMAIANALLAFGNVFAEGGMGAALIQHKKVTQRHINAALQGGLIIGFIFFALLAVFAPLIAAFFGHSELSLLIQVIGINFILIGLSSVSVGLLQKKFQFKKSSLVSILSCFLGYFVGVILGINGFGVWSLVFATLVYSFLKAVGYFILAPIQVSFKLYPDEWKELFSFGSGMILLKTSNYIASGGLNLVLGKIFTPAVLGVFDRTFQLKTLPAKYLGNILDKIMFPAMSQIQDEEDRLFKVYQFGLGFSNSVLMPIALYLIFFSEEIVYLLLGQGWTEAITPLQIMFAVLPFSISSRMADSVIRAKGYIYKNVVRKYIYIFILLVSVSFGGYYYGLAGAAAGVTGSYVINYILMINLVKKIFGKSFKEIFFEPLREALLLTLATGFILLLYHFVLGQRENCNITNYLFFSIILASATFLIAIKKPSFLGYYIKLSINTIFKKL